MTLPAGKKEYQETHNGITIQGFSYTETEIKQSVKTVADICFDVSGQIHTLQSLRDTLLPKLMSGEIRVTT